MAAVFEVSISFKEVLPFEVVFDTLDMAQLPYTISSIEVMDNWEYENLRSLDIETTGANTLTDYVRNNNIITLRGFINNNQCGFSSELISCNANLVEAWISLEHLEFLDTDHISHCNSEVYELITNIIVKLSEHHQVDYCAIGVETYLSYQKHIDAIIEDSNNVNRWIISDKQQPGIAAGFSTTKKNDFVILSREK